MAPTPASKSATPSSKSNTPHHQLKTPQSKHRLNFNKEMNPSASDHPVEVIGRIRDHPDMKPGTNPSALQVNNDGKSLRVKTEIGFRDFSFDGVSLSEEDDLEGFYKKFVESRINGVKLGNKCTIMMYGPTGSGKSHTMFGCLKQPGIVYKSLKDILSEEEDENGEKLGVGKFVQVTVLEIYNEEIYDLLSSQNTGGGFSLGWPKGGSASKVRLEVMGKKAKNATFISGNEAGKILKEIQKVEKRRIVKSTLCNERSSRSHCMIILDVPTVGGRLMLVDMAGSENIEQAGQIGLEAKMQTAKINQGNIALKRVVESIANGDSHVPFRDSKLTMLLQDSFEDNNSKILMILCASPDAKELHKTIATLEYGAKAKCIVRVPNMLSKEKGADDSSSAVILNSRIAALDQFISKLQVENKLRERECDDAKNQLRRKEEEVSRLRAKLAAVEGKDETSEEEINCKVNERTQLLRNELDRKIQDCQKMANEFVEMERRKMEQRMFQQQQEVEMLKRRLEDIESELRQSRAGGASVEIEDNSFMKRLLEACSEDSDMVKSMDLSQSMDFETNVVHKAETRGVGTVSGYSYANNFGDGLQSLVKKASLTTVYEEEEDETEEKNKENILDEEVQKEVIEEKKMIVIPVASTQSYEKVHYFNDSIVLGESGLYSEAESSCDASASRKLRIQNIFTLCGNNRELSQHNSTLMPCKERVDHIDSLSNRSAVIAYDSATTKVKTSPIPKPGTNDLLGENESPNIVKLSTETTKDLKENHKSFNENNGGIEVYVKWEALKENPGKFITTLKVSKDSTLADLRKLIESHLGGTQQAFTFLVLGDPSGAPVPKEEEATTHASKLPICNNQSLGHLACLRPLEPPTQRPPFSPLENMLTKTPNMLSMKKGDDCFSPKLAQNNNPSPFPTVRKIKNIQQSS
ncbi:P-loop containing nucleoside triphosphate hydrolases superfamily protein [Dorcoceras hygrometricum]|uniref:Kinesin-like protein KIN-10A n=1 Tax=Dorcoceras hygrometricum TaxID=472368 RepID=A0A2Z7D7U5_9LAMI|nr:P-loop containing nucleoside triphosphate hydrolases superfamily protein [Dorcoceras hygrometricum]